MNDTFLRAESENGPVVVNVSDIEGIFRLPEGVAQNPKFRTRILTRAGSYWDINASVNEVFEELRP